MSWRILLVGVAGSSRMRWSKADSLEELAALTATAGGVVVERLIQVRPKIDPATFVGKGMVENLHQTCKEHHIALLIFDEVLTPTQQRNLEDAIQVRVIDRAALILDIFALHARTAEAKIQVELAQLEYQRTRLTGFGVEMSRLGGGIGTRGPGETRLEVDRRRLEQRITALRKDLKGIDRERAVQRDRRTEMFRLVLAGYTNAGKSTLLNRMTNADVKVSDQLFATLDPNTKPWQLARNVNVLVTDTVGFIRNLPTQLVASFRSTLSEVLDASLVLHVVDASDEQIDRKIDAVNETLAAIGAGDKPVLMVFTKTDRVFDEAVLKRLKRSYARSAFVSGATGDGIDELKAELMGRVGRGMVTRTFTVPEHRLDLVSLLHDAGRVVQEEQLKGKRRLKVTGFKQSLARARGKVDAALRG
ncbi:MAG: GTPase HflX [candidate division WOR-3 bacterium]|nr:GTPase HflX [candidate division WOR-3 bacterium]